MDNQLPRRAAKNPTQYNTDAIAKLDRSTALNPGITSCRIGVRGIQRPDTPITP